MEDLMIVLAANPRAAQEFIHKYQTNVSPKAFFIVKGVSSIEGLRFRYENVIRVPGWSQNPEIEEIEDRILRTHVTNQPRLHFDTKDGVDWDVDANLPTYTRDFLKLINEGKIDDICTYGTVTH